MPDSYRRAGLSRSRPGSYPGHGVCSVAERPPVAAVPHHTRSIYTVSQIPRAFTAAALVSRLAIGATGLLVGLVPIVGGAQGPRSLLTPALRANATRAELEALLAAPGASPLVSAAERKGLSRILTRTRQRLAVGDFVPGDRVVVRITGEQVRSDTVQVQQDGTVRLAGFPAIPLTGVLRPEISRHLTTELTRYVRNITVEATSVVRIGAFGSVARPGFYVFSSDASITDVLVGAGGASPDANSNDVTVTRGGQELHDRITMTAALSQSLSLTALELTSGDVLMIGRLGQPIDRSFYIQLAGLGVSLVTALVLIRTVP